MQSTPGALAMHGGESEVISETVSGRQRGHVSRRQGSRDAGLSKQGRSPHITRKAHREPDWAALKSRDGRLLARATDPIDRRQQAVLFYLYSDDLAGLSEQLAAAPTGWWGLLEETPRHLVAFWGTTREGD
jgi:hypothetical protein